MSRPDGEVGITFHPAMIHGSATINGTRLALWAFLEQVWLGEDVNRVASDYDITRRDVLLGCWFVGTYGVVDHWTDKSGRPRRTGDHWRKRWGAWAREVEGSMWRGDWDDIPNPPVVTS